MIFFKADVFLFELELFICTLSFLKKEFFLDFDPFEDSLDLNEFKLDKLLFILAGVFKYLMLGLSEVILAFTIDLLEQDNIVSLSSFTYQ